MAQPATRVAMAFFVAAVQQITCSAPQKWKQPADRSKLAAPLSCPHFGVLRLSCSHCRRPLVSLTGRVGTTNQLAVPFAVHSYFPPSLLLPLVSWRAAKPDSLIGTRSAPATVGGGRHTECACYDWQTQTVGLWKAQEASSLGTLTLFT